MEYNRILRRMHTQGAELGDKRCLKGFTMMRMIGPTRNRVLNVRICTRVVLCVLAEDTG